MHWDNKIEILSQLFYQCFYEYQHQLDKAHFMFEISFELLFYNLKSRLIVFFFSRIHIDYDIENYVPISCKLIWQQISVLDPPFKNNICGLRT